MYTAEQAISEARDTHREFRDHARTCDHCRLYYPWCELGRQLEDAADAATARWEAFR